MASKIKLLQTVKAFHEEGKTKLSASELRQIEAETRDLLSRSRGKRAAKAPEGFDSLLAQLEGKSPDEAYDAVLSFLKDKGEIGKGPGGGKGLGLDDDGPGMGMGLGKGMDKGMDMEIGKPKFDDDMDDEPSFGGGLDMDKKPSFGGEKEDKPDFGGMDKKPKFDDDDEDEEKEEKKEKPDFGDKEDKEKKPEKKDDDKKEDKDEKKDKKDKKDDDKKDEKKDDKKDKDLEEKKEALLRKARKAQMSQMSEKDMKKDKLKFRQNKDRMDDSDENTMAEMGIEDTDNAPLVTARMKQARVIITKNGNLTAHNLDLGKPVFHVTVPNEVKANINELKKFANRVYGWIVYKGWKEAAKKCNAFVLNAGVDEDIDTNFDAEIEGDTKGVTEEFETNMRQDPDSPEDDVLKEMDTNTEEKPETVTAARRRIRDRVKARLAMKRKATDILDGSLGDNIDGEDNQTKPSGDTQVDATNDMEIKPSTENSDLLSDGDVDHKEAAENYRRLYASKAKKAAEEAVSNWVAKFHRCIKIASARMRLNHDANPFKIAAADVLTAEDVQFSDGDFYNPMDTKVAVELVELMSNEGHDGFVSHLLKSASDLLEKSDEYLADAESDLDTLSPNPVSIEEKSPVVTARSKDRRNALRKGNVELTGVSTTPSTKQTTNYSVRDALACGTSVGRKIARFNP